MPPAVARERPSRHARNGMFPIAPLQRGAAMPMFSINGLGFALFPAFLKFRCVEEKQDFRPGKRRRSTVRKSEASV